MSNPIHDFSRNRPWAIWKPTRRCRTLSTIFPGGQPSRRHFPIASDASEGAASPPPPPPGAAAAPPPRPGAATPPSLHPRRWLLLRHPSAARPPRRCNRSASSWICSSASSSASGRRRSAPPPPPTAGPPPPRPRSGTALQSFVASVSCPTDGGGTLVHNSPCSGSWFRMCSGYTLYSQVVSYLRP